MNKNFKLFLVNVENSIKESMIKIKKNGTRTLLVVKKNNFLLGTISEGDIHAALIQNFSLRLKYKKNFQ